LIKVKDRSTLQSKTQTSWLARVLARKRRLAAPTRWLGRSGLCHLRTRVMRSSVPWEKLP